MSDFGKMRADEEKERDTSRSISRAFSRFLSTATMIVPISLSIFLAVPAQAVGMQETSDGPLKSESDSKGEQRKNLELIEQIATSAEERSSIIKGVDRQKRDNEFSLREPVRVDKAGAFKLRDSSRVTLSNQQTRTDSFLERGASFPNILSPRFDATVIENSSLIGLRFAADPNRPSTTGLEVALTTAMKLRPVTRPGASYSITGQSRELADQFYDLGLRLGYWGFRIDATIVRQNNAYAGDYNGFGLGIGYNSSRFDTSISLKAFTEGDHLAGINEVDQAIHDVEFGAAYRLTRNLSLKGQVNYTRFNNSLLENRLGVAAQSVYLTGRLSF